MRRSRKRCYGAPNHGNSQLKKRRDCEPRSVPCCGKWCAPTAAQTKITYHGSKGPQRKQRRRPGQLVSDVGFEAFLIAKWRWAHKIMNMAPDRWTSRTTKWRDSHWCFVQGSRPLRVRPGRFMKWEDDLRQYAASETWINWQEKAKDPLTWNAHESKYVKWAWR